MKQTFFWPAPFSGFWFEPGIGFTFPEVAFLNSSQIPSEPLDIILFYPFSATCTSHDWCHINDKSTSELCVCVCVCVNSVMSNSLWPHGLWPARILCPWDFPGKNTGVGCPFLLQEIFPTQGLNPGLPHCRQTLYLLSHQGSLRSLGLALNQHDWCP